MEPLSIVVDLDVLEHLRSGLFTGGEALAVNGFDLEAMIPALHRGVVIAIAFFAHAAHQMMLAEQLLVLM